MQALDSESPFVDSAERLQRDAAAVQKKSFLNRIYRDFYEIFRRQLAELPTLTGRVIELGSGGGLIKRVLPDVTTSDVIAGPDIDLVAPAEHLPFDGGVKAILMVNVFHHLPRPDAFLREAERTLATGGRVIMIEPYNSRWARLVYKRLHPEPFDETVGDWATAGAGRLSTSNQAMAWIVFHRDRSLFEQRFSRLMIRQTVPHNVLAYPLSGGLGRLAFLPGFCYPVIRAVDRRLSEFSTVFPLLETIVLEKR